MPLELMREEIIGEFKVVMYKDEKHHQIIVRLEDCVGKRLESGRIGFPQYLPIWVNERIDGPSQAEEYFQGLCTWVRNGRVGDILPFHYKDDLWFEEDG